MVRKYHNKKVTYDGHTFDSIKEMNYYLKLKLLEKAGRIKDLELQKEFELQPSYRLNNKTSRKITYRADFSYYMVNDDKRIVEDVKGFRNEIYKLKLKLFEYAYPNLTIKEITR